MKRYYLLVGATLMLGGCGGGSSTTTALSNEAVNVSGSLGSSYVLFQKRWYDKFLPFVYANSFGQIKKAVAIPIIDGEPLIEKSKELSIDSNGNFTVSLEKKISYEEDGKEYTFNVSWILLLEKNDATIEFLAIPNSSKDESLVTLPISKAKKDIELGLISKSKDEALSQTDLEDLSEDVTYNINQLKTLASMDDVMKSIINRYKNQKDGAVNETLHIVSIGDYSKIDTNFEKASNFAGYAFHFHGDSNSILASRFNSICDTNGTIKLIPPANSQIKDKGVIYSPSNPFVSSSNGTSSINGGGRECGGDNFYARYESGDVVLNFITGDDSSDLANTIPIPDGNFKLQFNDGTVVGNYILSYGIPLKNGKLKVPTPAIKLDIDSNNRVKGLWIKWYIYDGSNYQEIDSDTLGSMISSYSVHGNDFNGISSNTSRLEFHCDNQELNTNYVNLNGCQNYPANGMFYNYSQEDKYSLDSIQVNIYLGATEYRFNYRK